MKCYIYRSHLYCPKEEHPGKLSINSNVVMTLRVTVEEVMMAASAEAVAQGTIELSKITWKEGEVIVRTAGQSE
jgi:hypothetical protein